MLYKQIRCTRGGKEFAILKFRSMRVDAEKDGVARLAARHDSRITPIGRFIRAVRIDELPQLINILKGEMSVPYRAQTGAAGNHRTVSGRNAGICFPHKGEGGAGGLCPGIWKIQHHAL